jgi:hypothetical protein
MLKAQITTELSKIDELESEKYTLGGKDRSSCTAEELDLLRRERNRMHAKKTRLRKKKMFTEMEQVSTINYKLFFIYFERIIIVLLIIFWFLRLFQIWRKKLQNCVGDLI